MVNAKKMNGSMHEGPVLVPLLIRKPQFSIIEKDEKNRISKVSAHVKNVDNFKGYSEAIRSDIQRIREENQGLIQQNKNLYSQIGKLEEEKQIQLQKISILESDRNDLKSKVSMLWAENADMKKRIENIDNKNRDYINKAAGLELDVKKIMDQLEKLGQTNENLKMEKPGQTRENPKQQTGKKAETSSAKSSRRKTAMDISARILEEFNSSANHEQTPVISFGSYVQDTGRAAKPIKWKVLEKKGKSMLLLSDRILDVKPYHDSNIAVTWEGCDLRTWLNVGFVKEAFRGEEEFLLKYVEIENHNNKSYDTRGGKNTKDRVFLLSQSDYYQYFPNKDFAKASATDEAKRKQLSCCPGTDYGYWWLRTPGSGVVKATQVNPDGNLISSGGNVTESKIGVRPALWLELK